MGAKLATTPNETESKSKPENMANQTNLNGMPKNHPHSLSNVDPSTIPSECPMHQAKDAKNVQNEACPIKGATSDINPLNMVINL